ncbi:MAG: hypothetical protein EBX09_06650 [Actinobacteria bacterium]|nr:hypothetical protein [Actinomycetota bacterium]NCX33708.1 hypothetical protein [Actinomycetota bacterium]NCX76698.1 hypothetical protein [Actinomycetota bacterium]
MCASFRRGENLSVENRSARFVCLASLLEGGAVRTRLNGEAFIGGDQGPHHERIVRTLALNEDLPRGEHIADDSLARANEVHDANLADATDVDHEIAADRAEVRGDLLIVMGDCFELCDHAYSMARLNRSARDLPAPTD